MRKTLTCVFVGVFTFALSTAATKWYYRWSIQFRSIAVGSMGMCSEGENQGMGGFTACESYDGEKLTFSSIRFSSDDEALACFETLLRSEPVTIVSREDLFDKSGKTLVGERVVGHNEHDGPNSGFIISRDGDRIFDIGSTSMRHTLIFDARSRRY